MTKHFRNVASREAAVTLPLLIGGTLASFSVLSMQRLSAVAVIAALGLAAANVQALAQGVDNEPPSIEAEKELPVELPALPKDEDLRSFYVSPTSMHVFSIDLSSLSVGTDGIVRYTLVSRSQAGAVNISHEGIRCETGERKSYAFGRSGGEWVRSQRSGWQPLRNAAANRQYMALANDYFCQGRTVRGNRDEIAKRLHSGRTGQPLGS